jgi:hypothetical protein
MSAHHLAARHREWTSIKTVQVRRRFGTALPRAANWDRAVDLRQLISIRVSGGRVAAPPVQEHSLTGAGENRSVFKRVSQWLHSDLDSVLADAERNLVELPHGKGVSNRDKKGIGSKT